MYSVQDTLAGGFPHSEIHGSKFVRNSPWLIAAYDVLHRLSAPRHPPNALKALDHSHCRCPPRSFEHGDIDRRKDQLLRDLPDHRRLSLRIRVDRPRDNPAAFGQIFSSRCQGSRARALLEGNAGTDFGSSFADAAHHESRGGARRDRTDDLLLAKQALSQLSYGPGAGSKAREMVGPGRVELPTSRLSGVRSNHLSYGPPIPGQRSPKTGMPDRSRPGQERPGHERPTYERCVREERETKTAGSRQMVPDLGPCVSKRSDSRRSLRGAWTSEGSSLERR
jgi:hypothetical protein